MNPLLSKLIAMVRRNKKPLVTVGIVLALFLIPSTRDLVLLNLELANEPQASPSFGWIPKDRNVPINAVDALEIAERTAKETRGRSYWDMIRRYPNDPALYANMLRFGVGKDHPVLMFERLRPGTKKKYPEKLVLNDEVRRLQDAIRIGQHLEPKNMFFDLFDAYVLFGLGRDDEAILAVHRAALKPFYDPHVRDMMVARLTYGPRYTQPIESLYPIHKLLVATTIEFRDCTSCRDLAYMAMGHSASGPDGIRRSIGTMSDLVKIGGRMRDGSGQLIYALVGTSIQRHAVRLASDLVAGKPVSEFVTKHTNETPSAKSQSATMLVPLRASVPSLLTERAWSELGRDMKRSDDFGRHASAYAKHLPALKPFVGSSVILMASNNAMNNIVFVWLFFWIPSYIWLACRRKLGLPDAGPRRLWIYFPLAILCIPVRPPHDSAQYLSPAFAIWSGWVIVTSKAVYWPVFLAALFRTRTLPGVGRVDTFFVRLRKGSMLAIQGLLVLYVVAMLVCIPSAIRTNRQLDLMIADETKLVWQTPIPSK